MRRVAAMFLAVLMLSGCSVQRGVEELLSPPRLTAEQSAIYDALESALGTSSFKFKYPRRGEHLSACILRDLDHDGKKEALAFYELAVGGISSTWMSILVQQDGVWRSTRQIPGAGSDIDLVSFSSITGQTADNVIVGWSGAGQEETALVVYSYDGARIERLHNGSFAYSEMLLVDVDKNGTFEMVLCTKGGDQSPAMRLMRYRAGRLDVVGEVLLSSGIKQYIRLQYGQLTAGLSAVFADVLMEGDTVETQIAAVEGMSLVEITGSDLGIEEGLKRPSPSLNCTDINNDGLIDIPVMSPLPGYDRERDGEPIYMTDYVSVIDAALVSVEKTVVNFAGGYRLRLPDAWVNSVTVKSRFDTKEWRFVFYDGSLASSEIELLRIKVVSPADYQDRLETADYRLLATKGVNRYMVYIPETDLPGYSISYAQLDEMLTLL